jgi:hypothetical protein
LLAPVLLRSGATWVAMDPTFPPSTSRPIPSPSPPLEVTAGKPTHGCLGRCGEDFTALLLTWRAPTSGASALRGEGGVNPAAGGVGRCWWPYSSATGRRGDVGLGLLQVGRLIVLRPDLNIVACVQGCSHPTGYGSWPRWI